ncbi:c-type cytochrome [Methylophaga pinxianii]|uniref:c-type cytochrome n=1 Tax=Methylophaga pinxianii TaxID=2881052 RepID=UPI001CF4377A|nr:c-type cytochrome [Methylophaga pinxianii]MCB2425936.1 cytochrome c4 [Methylophaga pinxianii]UPH46417.1 cytochrome c4 [Methylophaga pinxianii]
MKKFIFAVVLGLVATNSPLTFAAGDISAGKAKSAVCAACHGADGNSPSDMYPKLAGQHASYIYKQLVEFKSGERENAIMAPMAANLSEEDMADLAAYFSSQKTSPGAVSEDLLEQGKQIYRGGNSQSGVPACMACHGPNGSGMPAAKWPKLSAQYRAYTEAQLHAFAKGERHNDPNGMMRDIASKLTDEEIKAVSAYVSGLH